MIWPTTERRRDIVTEHHHQVIAFGKDHQARRRSDLADDVKNGVSVTVERSNARWQFGEGGPYKRLSGRVVDRTLLHGRLRLRFAGCQG